MELILEFDNKDNERILTKMITHNEEFDNFCKLLKANITAFFQNILTVLILEIPLSIFLSFTSTLFVISIILAIFSIFFLLILTVLIIFIVLTVLIFTVKYIKTFESAKKSEIS